MKAKKGYRKNKNITSFNNWFKRYFKNRTCKGAGSKNLINLKERETMTKEQKEILNEASVILDEERYNSAYYTKENYLVSQANKILKEAIKVIITEA